MEIIPEEQKKDEREGRNWRHLIGIQPEIINNYINHLRNQDAAYVKLMDEKERTGRLTLKEKIKRAFKRGNTKTYKIFQRLFVGK